MEIMWILRRGKRVGGGRELGLGWEFRDKEEGRPEV